MQFMYIQVLTAYRLMCTYHLRTRAGVHEHDSQIGSKHVLHLSDQKKKTLYKSRRQSQY